ncbi:putative neutral sphingomyelinase isoform X3 [Octopus sinensis]|uniref:sphingomyelin phosphodiesterase n=1 Tax=Octopus sinensis TaxID=2607531 RepID=A0A7E6FE54_9MOLL|nr:putative neutral sphingomyelinase isoform X3 [Octopus sinensis]
MFSLRILTLNCWAFPFPWMCKDKEFRIKSLAKALSESEYDIILLQEIWCISDFEYLQLMISNKLPHSHYFYSGSFGSGMCVFTKFPINDVLYINFRLNGYAHKLQHGDWFAGKGVGLIKVEVNGLMINIYITHIHAEYSKDNDEYFTHRLIQSFQLSQFIKQTSEKCDVVFVGGDCNMESDSLSYKILTTNAMLNDAWLKKPDVIEEEFASTCELPDNCYTSAASKLIFPRGIRIDYLLFRSNSGTDITVNHYERVFGKIPDDSRNYSDHEGVSVTFNLKTASTAQACPARDAALLSDHLQAMISEISINACKLSSDKTFWIVLAIFSTVIMFLMNCFSVGGTFIPTFMNLLIALPAVSIIICIWNGVVINNIESKVFAATKEEAKYLLNSKKEN